MPGGRCTRDGQPEKCQGRICRTWLLLYWQPAFALGEAHAGHPSHGEVLLRLRQPDGRISTPAPYLAAAERYDMAEKLDRWVIKTTFAWLAGHRQRLHQLSYLAINLSAQSLASEDFQQFLLGELRRLQLPGKRAMRAHDFINAHSIQGVTLG